MENKNVTIDECWDNYIVVHILVQSTKYRSWYIKCGGIQTRKISNRSDNPNNFTFVFKFHRSSIAASIILSATITS